MEREARTVHDLRKKHRLKDVLEATGLAKSTYMYWRKRFDRENPDEELEKKILEIRDEHKDYGYRRIKGELSRAGVKANKKKVQRLVQKLGLQVKSFTRKSRRYDSYRGKVGKTAPNRLNRRFDTSVPHQKITTDTSEFKHYETDEKGNVKIGKLYLDPFMDLCGREIVSYSISRKPSAEGIMDALRKALKATADCPYRRTFHSDQGWAYQMTAHRKELKANRAFQSMSRKGNCHDNAVMENFFGIMKQEMYHGRVYRSHEELKEAIERYIDYYNNKRIKESLGWLSPVEHRLSLSTA